MGKCHRRNEGFLYTAMRETIGYRQMRFTNVVNFNDPKASLYGA